MDLKTFFKHFILEHEIVRANLINATDFTDQASFIEFKMRELDDSEYLRKYTSDMSAAEIKLIRSLYHKEPDEDAIHHVDYNVDFYPTLIDGQYILEDGMNRGVIHQDIVNILYQSMTETGLMPIRDMYIKDESSLAEHQLSELKYIYTGPIYWFYNNFKFEELRKILSRLNVKPDGQYKEDFISQLVPLLTDVEYLKRALLTLHKNEYQMIQAHVKNDQHIYRKKSRWAAAKKTGLLVEIHRDYLAMHDDVLQTLKQIDFKSLDKERSASGSLQVDDYNGYHLELRITYDKEDITREIYVPTGMNFYELERIIKEVMGWKISSGSYFKTEVFKIYSTQLDASEVSSQTPLMIASFTQIDAVLDSSMQLVYEYNPGAGYSVNIVLKKLINLDRKIPKIIEYSGPTPIDNIGGIERLTKTLDILNDSTHEDYIPTYQKVRNLNYRKRYPMRAINKRMADIFKKSYPLTEFNE